MRSPLSIEVNDLLDEKRMRGFLDLLGKDIEAENSKVAGSIFMKRYAFLAVIFLYIMTSRNERLFISFENLSIETNEKEDVWLPHFHFSLLETETAGQDRGTWRRGCLEALFKEHFYPIISCISSVTKLSKLILWENIAVYIFWLYEMVFQSGKFDEDLIERAKEDFRYIIFQAEGGIFGNYHENPLKRFYNERIDVEALDKPIRQRKSCCFNYLTKSKQHCTTCPCMK